LATGLPNSGCYIYNPQSPSREEPQKENLHRIADRGVSSLKTLRRLVLGKKPRKEATSVEKEQERGETPEH